MLAVIGMSEYTENMLFSLADEKYRDFNAALIPNVDKEKIIGVRVPVLRQTAAKMKKEKTDTDFLKELPHRYYEENCLHALLLCNIKDFDILIEEIQKFFPYIDNWATCDILKPKIFPKNTDLLLPYIQRWITSEHTYTVRFAVEALMSYYADEKFDVSYLEIVSQIDSDEYYVKMMIAWYFATLLAKQWDSTICYLENKRLPDWIHRKTIQKAVESYRISPEQKAYLKTLR